MKKLLIFGASNPMIIQLIEDISLNGDEKFEIIGFSTDNEEDWGNEVCGIPILGKMEDLKLSSDTYIINNIGSSTHARYKVDKRILKLKSNIPSLIHPSVERRYSEIGEGCILSDNVFIGPKSKIGNSSCIRHFTLIGHDVFIGDYVFIATNSNILGFSSIESFSYLGANVTLLPSAKIKQNVRVGAGSVVTKDLEPNAVYVGSPAKYLRDNASVPNI